MVVARETLRDIEFTSPAPRPAHEMRLVPDFGRAMKARCLIALRTDQVTIRDLHMNTSLLASPPAAPTGDMGVVRRLLPYLWEFRGRVVLAVTFLVAAKLANIAVPLVMKRIVDGLTGPAAVAAIPVTLLVAYGLLRLSS